MSDHDLWHVKLSEGCVVEMTLDEIDTAFNAGRIKASTSVLPPGDFRWTTLGEAAGLDDDDRPTEPAPYSIAPVAADVTPPPPAVDMDLDVDLESLAGLPRPKRAGAFGKVVAVTAVFALLVAAGVGGGAYAARPVEFKAKLSSLTSRFSKAAPPAETAAAAPPPPVAREIPPPVPSAPAPAVVEPAKPAQASVAGTSVTSLPDAKPAKKTSKKKRR